MCEELCVTNENNLYFLFTHLTGNVQQDTNNCFPRFAYYCILNFYWIFIATRFHLVYSRAEETSVKTLCKRLSTFFRGKCRVAKLNVAPCLAALIKN